MSRNVIISLAFMNSDIIEKSFDQLYRTRNYALPIEHVVLNQHYPLAKEKNQFKLESICGKRNIKIYDSGKNLGLHDGFNYVMKRLELKSDDIVIGYDPDSFPTSTGWDMALVRAIRGDDSVVWSSLMGDRAEKELDERGFSPKIIDHHIKVRETKKPVVNSVCAWRYGWLEKVGFLTEPHAFYGGLECSMWNKLQGKQWVFTEDYREDDRLRDGHDRAYVEYKWAHAHLQTWKGDFQSWLDAGRPLPDREKEIVLP